MSHRPVRFLAPLAGTALLAPAAHAACGDGILDSGETCDDLNTTDGDGCDSSCLVEAGWECVDASFAIDFAEVLSDDSTHSTPSWTLSSDGLTVTQSLNADAAVYVTTLPANGVWKLPPTATATAPSTPSTPTTAAKLPGLSGRLGLPSRARNRVPSCSPGRSHVGPAPRRPRLRPHL